MAGEGESQPPKAAPKAPAITSAFINKGAKTFAPKKAVRRRPPGVTAPKPVAPSTVTPTSTGSVEQVSPTQAQAQPDVASAAEQATLQPDLTPAIEQQSIPQLPTPVPTQEPVRQDAPQTEQTVPEPPTVVGLSTSSPVVEPSPAPAPTNKGTESQLDGSAVASFTRSAPRTVTPPVAEEESGRSPKRRRIEAPNESETRQPEPDVDIVEPLPAVQEGPVHNVPVEDDQPELNQSTAIVTEQTNEITAGSAADVVQPGENVIRSTETPSRAPIVPPETPAEIEHVAAENNDTENATVTQAVARPARGKQAWNAVNATDDNGVGPATTPKHRKPAGRRRRKVVTLRNLDEEEEGAATEVAEAAEGGDTDNDFVPPRTKRSSAKARGKRKATEASVEEEEGSTVRPPVKKKRQPKETKAKNTTPAEARQNVESGPEVEITETVENGQGVESEQNESRPSAGNDESNRAAARPKPTRKKKRQTTSQPDDAGEGEQGGQLRKRKGRPARAPTPSDAEDEVIDEDSFFMDDLARRDIRFGKLSQREKKMRTIDWEEVRQRQKEKEAEQMNSRAVHEKMAREQQEREDAARTVQEQVRYEYDANGEMRIVQGSGQVDHERLAEERFTETVVEEDDFTNRINARSFMRNNKRYPEEFLLPGQGKRWDVRSTADFYDALRMFGTDFGMMTSLFEGVTRRSLKLKFTREERKNPELINKILQHKDTRLKDWDEFLKASGKENEEYDRVEQIKRELEEREEEGRIEIERAKAEYEEDQRQRRLAGFASDEEGGNNGTGKKKKGKKGREKQVTFQQDEEGVEILEADENDGWGEE